MPLPKRKHSKARRDKRRANWRISPPNFSVCPQCKKPRLPHRVCPHCGYYNGKPVVIIEEKKPEKGKK
jgi:large subunit ribosomal protein L32